jgi:tRNA A37 threonylcarbamoyladenosine modification protein TsaB
LLDPAAIGAVHGAGNAFARYPELREHMVAAGLRIHDGVYPRADAVVRLARVKFAAGRTVRAHEALPVYIRDNVATPGRR